MRKIHDVLRLHFGLKLPQLQIARSIQLSQSTGLQWPLPEGYDDRRLQQQLFGTAEAEESPACRPLPDFAQIRHELTTNRHISLQLLWEEYRNAHPDKPYSYTTFWRRYEQWRTRQDLVMRQQHKAGEKLFVDWAGPKIPIHDRGTGEIAMASLFVAVLGASSYAYAEAALTQELEAWIGAHVRTFEFLNGPEVVVPDNARTAVNKTCRYEPDLNPTYQEMAMHYGIGVVPARVRKPRDKATVEVGVQIAQRWIVAALRHRKFFSLGDLNVAIWELLEKLNSRPFKKRDGCRRSLFEELDQTALKPLPAERYDLSVWSKAMVNIDYHVQVKDSFYSVPYTLAQKSVEVRTTATTVEIFHQGSRVASHIRAKKPHTAVTQNEHRPKAHQAQVQWPPSRLIDWARKAGPCAAQLFRQILERYPHPEMGYRSCLGLLRLGEKYGAKRLESACERAQIAGAANYKSVKSILAHALDTQPLSAEPDPPRGAGHDNIRGAGYYQ